LRVFQARLKCRDLIKRNTELRVTMIDVVHTILDNASHFCGPWMAQRSEIQLPCLYCLAEVVHVAETRIQQAG
jgi:hypothetical protein